MNRGLRKIINTMRDVIPILGILPIAFYYQIHVEQIATLNQHIEFLKSEIESLKEGQIGGVWDKFKSLKEFTDLEITDLRNDLKHAKGTTDSLRKFLEVHHNDSSLTISLRMARLIQSDLEKKDLLEELVKTQDQEIRLQGLQINDCKKIVTIFHRLDTLMTVQHP